MFLWDALLMCRQTVCRARTVHGGPPQPASKRPVQVPGSPDCRQKPSQVPPDAAEAQSRIASAAGRFRIPGAQATDPRRAQQEPKPRSALRFPQACIDARR